MFGAKYFNDVRYWSHSKIYFHISECTEDEPKDFLWLPERSLKTFSSGFSIWKYENLNSPSSLELPSLSSGLSHSPGTKQSELWQRYERGEGPLLLKWYRAIFIKYPRWCDKPVNYVTHQTGKMPEKVRGFPGDHSGLNVMEEWRGWPQQRWRRDHHFCPQHYSCCCLEASQLQVNEPLSFKRLYHSRSYTNDDHTSFWYAYLSPRHMGRL